MPSLPALGQPGATRLALVAPELSRRGRLRAGLLPNLQLLRRDTELALGAHADHPVSLHSGADGFGTQRVRCWTLFAEPWLLGDESAENRRENDEAVAL